MDKRDNHHCRSAMYTDNRHTKIGHAIHKITRQLDITLIHPFARLDEKTLNTF